MDEDFQSTQSQIQAALIATTRTAGQIAAEDLAFQRSLNPSVGAALDKQSARFLSLSRSLLQSSASVSDLKIPDLDDSDDVENNWPSIVDVIDSLLEKADTCLDEYTGLIKNNTPVATESTKQTKHSNSGSTFRARNILKPQLAFEHPPNNEDTSPWKPLLTSKPHAIESLEESLTTREDELGNTIYKHPYEREITDLTYPKAALEKSEPTKYLPFETTSAVFVDTYEQVLEMLEELKKASLIAIDLEHHDSRTYVGLVSLMQISTRDRDWIVDTLKPWRQDLQVLNEVFADPSIIKVLHGAFMDIIWLQRDLGLYVVGLFDTNHAARALGYPSGGLAYLLKKFIDFDADKKYQLADWRIRPLPEEMFFYARADTHFLLYIFDNIRNELIDKPGDSDEDLLNDVLEKSKETSLFLFKRQIYDAEKGKGPGGWFQQLNKSSVAYSPEQFAVFRAVHRWRDQIARIDDDSTNFVMPNHVLFSLSRLMPMDMVALLRALHPISHNVKSRTAELLALIKKAKAKGANGPSMLDYFMPDTWAYGGKSNGTRATAEITLPIHGLPAASGESLQSNESQFWGAAFGSSIWDHQSKSTANGDSGIRLAVPMPPLNSELFAAKDDYGGLLEVKPSQVDTVQPSKEAVEEPSDEAFSLNRGTKRKEIETEANCGASLDAEQKAAAKAARKAAKKAEKARLKLKNLQAGGSAAAQDAAVVKPQLPEDEEAFDYGKAQSVLHPAVKSAAPQKAKRQPFDPYTKGSEETPKGMKRLQTEKAGRSHTFKK